MAEAPYECRHETHPNANTHPTFVIFNSDNRMFKFKYIFIQNSSYSISGRALQYKLAQLEKSGK